MVNVTIGSDGKPKLTLGGGDDLSKQKKTSPVASDVAAVNQQAKDQSAYRTELASQPGGLSVVSPAAKGMSEPYAQFQTVGKRNLKAGEYVYAGKVNGKDTWYAHNPQTREIEMGEGLMPRKQYLGSQSEPMDFVPSEKKYQDWER